MHIVVCMTIINAFIWLVSYPINNIVFCFQNTVSICQIILFKYNVLYQTGLYNR